MIEECGGNLDGPPHPGHPHTPKRYDKNRGFLSYLLQLESESVIVHILQKFIFLYQQTSTFCKKDFK